MIHAHVYIENAPFTKSIIPCGALEEFYEIIKEYPERTDNKYLINLKGHGSLAMSSDVNTLLDIPYYPRPIPEDA